MYAPAIRRVVLQVLPQRDDMVDRFVAVLHNASRSVFISIVFVPIIQGTLTGIGLRLLDVPDPAFWGLLAVFSAVIPLAGTAIVWLPITVYLWATQSLASALMLLAWGSIVVSGSDNLLRPYFLKTGIEVSMVVLLLSIVCSLAVFGAVGIIAGPVMVALAVRPWWRANLFPESTTEYDAEKRAVPFFLHASGRNILESADGHAQCQIHRRTGRISEIRQP